MMFTMNYIQTNIEITRIQRGIADCLFHNEHLHNNGNTCVACENSKKYLSELKEYRLELRNKL